MRRSRVGRHLFIEVVVGVSLLSVGGAGASELDPLQGVVEETADTVTATTGQVTGTVNDTTETVTGTVNDTTETVTGTLEQTTGAVAGSTTQAVDEVSGSDSQGKAASAAGDGARGNQGFGATSTSGPDSKRRLAAVEASMIAFSQQSGQQAATRPPAGGSDPCANEISPACLLDALYGVGDTAPEVLGTFFRNLASTGLALAALILVALLALASGAGALTWSGRMDRGRATPA